MTDVPIDPHAPSLGFIVNPQTGTGAATGGNMPLICSDERHAAKVAALDSENDRLRAKIAEIDHIINWHTTCASCARALDSSYAETMRAETAEAALKRVHALASRLEEFGENALKQDDRRLYNALATDLRNRIDGPTPEAAAAQATDTQEQP